MEQNPKYVNIDVDTKEEALEIVKAFWKGRISSPGYYEQLCETRSFLKEYTEGDRTAIYESPKVKGKSRVFISGNGGPISDKGWNWLKNSGYNLLT